MKISIIVAIARNGAIGFKNKLLYWLPNDLKRFKSLTTGHTIIMGRKTFESLPKGALPNRRNLVLSHQDINFPGAERYASLESALSHCSLEEEVFIIGGASIYQEAMPLADTLYPVRLPHPKNGSNVMLVTNHAICGSRRNIAAD